MCACVRVRVGDRGWVGVCVCVCVCVRARARMRAYVCASTCVQVCVPLCVCVKCSFLTDVSAGAGALFGWFVIAPSSRALHELLRGATPS